MRIGIDARMLGSKQGGIGRYIEEITKSFANENNLGDFQFVVFLRKENWDLVDGGSGFKKVLVDIPWYGWREQLFLSKILKKEKVDLMHFPHWNIPFFYRLPFVVTIHDLLLLHYPTRAASTLGPLTYFFKNLAYRLILRHAIKNSKLIFTPSEFTKNDILKNFKIKPEKISVTPLGISDFQFLNFNQSSNFNFQTLAEKYKIIKPYVLYLGAAFPHKNLSGLIKAWKIFCHEHGNGFQLVLAGRKNYFYEKIKKEVLSFADLEKQSVVFLDYLPDNALPALYQKASLFVFPSFYEGFGLPPLEAIQYNLPVVSSNAACLPEVLLGAALYFDPTDIKDMAETIWQGLTDENLRQKLIKNSVQLIHNYSWEKAAKLTLAGYKSVI